MKSFTENTKVLLALIFGVLFFAAAYLNQNRLKNKRLNAPVYKCAVISKVSISTRGNRDIQYVFYLNGSYVKGLIGLDKNELSNCTPDNPWCVGKVYKVIFEEGNYKNSDLLLDDSCDDLIEKDTAIKWLLEIEYYKPDGKHREAK
ncbi:MAG: hypothetical protein M9887_04285 [Chitinophagales bacterium]|nr:hypothetical protein [Chitinophagales bacterium]